MHRHKILLEATRGFRRVALCLSIIAAVSSFSAAEKTPETRSDAETGSMAFSGYANIAGDRVFILLDAATKDRSPWIKLGQTWRGYTLTSFDQEAKKLNLRSEQADLSLNLIGTKIGRETSWPILAKGSYTSENGMLVYGPDAQLRLTDGTLVSSPTGVMVTNEDQSVIGGDLTVKTGKATLQITDGMIQIDQGKMTVTGKQNAVIEVSQGQRPVTLTAKRIVITSDSVAKAKEPEQIADRPALPASPTASP